jgi:hypothetical protein
MPLTRHALFALRLEEMRQRGEHTEGMSRYAPTASMSSYPTEQRVADEMEYMKQHGPPTPPEQYFTQSLRDF